MEEKKKEERQPMQKSAIYKLMIILAYAVSSVFLLKNIISKSITGSVVILISLLLFSVVLFVMKMFQVKDNVKQFVVSMALMLVVFLISSNSGASYSDDFAMFLAVMALTGMYLRPKYTLVQLIMADILLVVLYVINPATGGAIGQFVLCMGTFTLAGVLFYLVIKRGRSFITRSTIRAAETEELLKKITEMGENLQRDAQNSLDKVEVLQKTNSDFEGNVNMLRIGSEGIIQGADDVAKTCENVSAKIQVTDDQINALNDEVKGFEVSLAENRKNMQEMSEQMETVKVAMKEANEVFLALEQQMIEICKVTEQMNSITSSTSMLALNASIEAARAGHMGAGFAVVASKVKELAVDSDRCSEEVVKVVALMQKQVKRTTEQMEDSANAIDGSLSTLEGLQDSFDGLTKQFGSLYNNIEEQNHNIDAVNEILAQLNDKVSEMGSHSEENQASVESITQNMLEYRESVKAVIEDTRHVHALSVDMMNYSKDQEIDTETEK